ncbi:S8 family serine peptidase [Subsaximicrobium wynnwilliamsii]|uniref:S8 family serine peptidase n=1 Tax=Subsaximicrobium wynnwilliamsii TaxID=291179 RepID=A0A5C6ZH30_9FLAO|nr:S8 family serine peptidase [Subsaximicrobium wynnwilliamsii]TXD82776.1 S8 family serine peptidase [Subsaximicrobium wynnwilliamsii]TXD88500.1 S8 family serine peptidase [Subsaximicrobium wynnwilliamsii]TXE02504.1 S8 family serine peptidase [Subsaximicrobium wynnwilliamsii]
MKRSVLIIFVLCCHNLIAQEDAWVYLTDKPNVEASINNPISILTQQAIDRKTDQGIAIDVRDVPVNEAYITQLKNAEGITVYAKSKWFNSVYVRGSETDISALMTDFDFVATIDFADAELNALSRSTISYNKFEIEETLVNFNYGNTQNQVEMIGVDDLHLSDFTGEGIIVAVMDSGFPNVNTMGAFQRLRDNADLLGGYDFVDRTENVYDFNQNDHGTKVLSDMAGFIQDQFVGTAPDASYYVFRTEDIFSETPVEEAYWVEAAERADSLGVQVINTSLGYKTYDNPNYSHSDADLNGSTTFITRGANVANEKGILVITSAGNSGQAGVGAPADATGVLSVAAVDAEGNYVAFSSQGSAFQATQKPDVAAQGFAAAVINLNNATVYNNGTSFSSPILAGGIASLLQALPNTSHEDIKALVRMSASQYENPDFLLGYGIPDLSQALAIGLSVENEAFYGLKVFPNPVGNTLHITQQSRSETTKFRLLDVLGKTILKQNSNTLETQLDLSSLNAGIYVLQIQSEKASKTFKIIKR